MGRVFSLSSNEKFNDKHDLHLNQNDGPTALHDELLMMRLSV